ncbi:MAG: hypothetical protein AAF297_00275 [Planctomycetota bacterium]
MDRKTAAVCAFAAAVSGVSGVASAGYSDRDTGPVVSPFDSLVTITLIERRAGWNGELSLIDVGAPFGEPDTSFLMTNNKNQRGVVEYVGQFDAGESIFFQYEVVSGTKNVFRMDDKVGLDQFRHEWLDKDTARLYVEDIKLPGGDADYNDGIYELSFLTIPTPGAVGVAAAGLLMMGARRRR